MNDQEQGDFWDTYTYDVHLYLCVYIYIYVCLYVYRKGERGALGVSASVPTLCGSRCNCGSSVDEHMDGTIWNHVLPVFLNGSRMVQVAMRP